ncbi:MAG: hypothetical protein H0X12_00290 [Nocardioides sp.]|nr:hypothetical protein [Nocardioides sp.]
MSDARDPRVDNHIAGLPPSQQELCERLRSIAHAADPEITETIKRAEQPRLVADNRGGGWHKLKRQG